MYHPVPLRGIGYHHAMAQAAPPPAAPAAPAAPATSAAAVPVSGPWYSTIWYEPAVYGVPVIPTILGLGVLAGAFFLLGASRR